MWPNKQFWVDVITHRWVWWLTTRRMRIWAFMNDSDLNADIKDNR